MARESRLKRKRSRLCLPLSQRLQIASLRRKNIQAVYLCISNLLKDEHSLKYLVSLDSRANDTFHEEAEWPFMQHLLQTDTLISFIYFLSSDVILEWVFDAANCILIFSLKTFAVKVKHDKLIKYKCFIDELH